LSSVGDGVGLGGAIVLEGIAEGEGEIAAATGLDGLGVGSDLPESGPNARPAATIRTSVPALEIASAFRDLRDR
jgi:hypothetical protein